MVNYCSILYADKHMEEIAISKFKATCLAVLERVRRTGQPVQITRFGKAIAEVIPPTNADKPKRRLGTLAGSIEILGDIVGPIGDESDWEAAGPPGKTELDK
jgi:antitoxin (DNA-binding transcriptional repressor) of toxin-antitoxin stability system